MDDLIILATNTLAAVTDTWDHAVGHPTARKDRSREKEDILTPELMDQLVNIHRPTRQHVPRMGLKVTKWTVLDHTPDTPHEYPDVPPAHLVGPTVGWEGHCDQGTDAHTGDTHGHPIGTRGPFQTLHPPHQPPSGTLAGTQKGYGLYSGCPGHGHNTPHHVARPGPQRSGLRAHAWDDADAALDVMVHERETDYQDPHCQPANPRQQVAGHAPAQARYRPAHSILQGRNAPKPAPQPAPEPVRPKPQPRLKGEREQAWRAKRPKLPPKVALPPPEPNAKRQTYPYFTPDGRKAMHPEYGAEVQGVYVC